MIRSSTSCVALLFLALAYFSPTRAQAAGRAETWTLPDGRPIRGAVSEVFGSLVFISGKDGTAFLSVATMSDEEVERVAAFLSERPGVGVPWAKAKTVMSKAVLGSVEQLRDGKLVPFEEGDRAEPDIYLVYFSAGWCGPCHRFTPELVAAYRRYQQYVPGRIEVIFVSDDEGAGSQAQYVREMQMPWLVLKYHLRNSARDLTRWAGNGIPCLVALTRKGELMVHSYVGGEYKGPGRVLAVCDELVRELVSPTPDSRSARHRLAVARHVRACGGGDSQAAPYLIGLDPARFAGIRAPELSVVVTVDEKGKVARCECDGGSMDLQRMIEDESASWLFLPAIRDGKPCRQTLKIPVKLDGTPAAAASH